MCVFVSLGAIAAAGSRCCVCLGAFVQGAAAVCAWECWHRCWCCRKGRKGQFRIWCLRWRNFLDSVSYWVSYFKYRKSCVSLDAGAPVCAWGRCCALAPLLLVLPENLFAIWGLCWRNWRERSFLRRLKASAWGFDYPMCIRTRVCQGL